LPIHSSSGRSWSQATPLWSVDFKVQTVLRPRNLAGGEGAARPLAHAERHRPEISCRWPSRCNPRAAASCRDVSTVLGRLCVLYRSGGRRTRVMRNPVTCSAMSHQCEPGPPGSATGRWSWNQAPVPIRVVQQPVLGIVPCTTRISPRSHPPHAAHVLHHGVEAQVVKVQLRAGSRRQLHQPARSPPNRQRLLANHVLAGIERVLGHGEMHEVGCTDVHRIDGRVFQNPAVIRVDLLDAEFGA